MDSTSLSNGTALVLFMNFICVKMFAKSFLEILPRETNTHTHIDDDEDDGEEEQKVNRAGNKSILKFSSCCVQYRGKQSSGRGAHTKSECKNELKI